MDTFFSKIRYAYTISTAAVTIDRLVVLPRFQGRGIKEWLIDACFARLGDESHRSRTRFPPFCIVFTVCRVKINYCLQKREMR